jgi:hypothetical protein
MTTKNKIITKVVSLSVLVVSFAISAWAINRYFYDWFHNVSLLPCSEKGITLVNKVHNSEADLGELLDLSKLKNDLNDNPDYKVSEKYPSQDLFVKRKFADKEYLIVFNNYDSRKTTYYEIRTEFYTCASPVYPIKQSSEVLINGLPFSETQKKKIRDNISVTNFFRVYAG